MRNEEFATSADGYPTERDYISPGELHCRCAVRKKLLPGREDLWNWTNAALVHGLATQAEIARRIGLEQRHITRHYTNHIRPWLLNRPEYRIRADLMEKLAQVADEGGMALPEMMAMHARIAAIIMNARAVEAYGSMEPSELVRQAREAAIAADMAATRAVQRAKTRLQTQEGQRELFERWRSQLVAELTDPKQLQDLLAAVEQAKKKPPAK